MSLNDYKCHCGAVDYHSLSSRLSVTTHRYRKKKSPSWHFRTGRLFLASLEGWLPAWVKTRRPFVHHSDLHVCGGGWVGGEAKEWESQTDKRNSGKQSVRWNSNTHGSVTHGDKTSFYLPVVCWRVVSSCVLRRCTVFTPSNKLSALAP